MIGFFNGVMQFMGLLDLDEGFDVGNEMQKLLIFLIVIERNDRYAILELIKVGVCCVIDEKDVL